MAHLQDSFGIPYLCSVEGAISWRTFRGHVLRVGPDSSIEERFEGTGVRRAVDDPNHQLVRCPIEFKSVESGGPLWRATVSLPKCEDCGKTSACTCGYVLDGVSIDTFKVTVEDPQRSTTDTINQQIQWHANLSTARALLCIETGTVPSGVDKHIELVDAYRAVPDLRRNGYHSKINSYYQETCDLTTTGDKVVFASPFPFFSGIGGAMNVRSQGELQVLLSDCQDLVVYSRAQMDGHLSSIDEKLRTKIQRLTETTFQQCDFSMWIKKRYLDSNPAYKSWAAFLFASAYAERLRTLMTIWNLCLLIQKETNATARMLEPKAASVVHPMHIERAEVPDIALDASQHGSRLAQLLRSVIVSMTHDRYPENVPVGDKEMNAVAVVLSSEHAVPWITRARAIVESDHILLKPNSKIAIGAFPVGPKAEHWMRALRACLDSEMPPSVEEAARAAKEQKKGPPYKARAHAMATIVWRRIQGAYRV